MNKIKNTLTKSLLTVLLVIVFIVISLIGLFYSQKLKVRASNPKSPEEVIKTYYRAMSYGEYEKAVSLYTERYKKQTQDYETKHAALYNKTLLTMVERIKEGRPLGTILLAPLVDLIPCSFSEYQAGGNSNQIKNFRVKRYGSRQYFSILEKTQTGTGK